MKKLKSFLISVGAIAFALVPAVAVVGTVVAEDLDLRGGLTSGTELCGIGEDCDADEDGTTVNDIVKTVINILSWVVGVVSVIMIIVAGFKYVTSGGQEKAVGDAKNTILYAIVGLVIVALSQVIVRFVLSNIGGE